jgi:acetyl/propionyl-CoA carboxylase alpha subunit
MIERLLIANRGEIARRIMRTCRELGIETVAVFSDADADAAFVQDADLSVSIGGVTPAESYLRVDALLDAAARTGADAVHPGYGFLAENAPFAQAVVDAGLVFVGPSPEVIAVMGSKLEAKRRMADAGVPLLPSAELTGLDDDGVRAAADQVGYPILVKASAGGGGRGMRIVPSPDELLDAVAGAAREAESAFGDGTVYAERYVAPSRHVEVQIFGDTSGRVVHFHERECSIQRRHQKIIEEAPSPSLDDETRSALHQAAVRAGEAIGYRNAGTVEFLLAPPGAEGRAEFFFLEVNTRLQVEHPVTEAVLGVDLVELQLDVATGGAVPAQDEIGPVSGHAIEARLYAEDPAADFRPSVGMVHRFAVPGRVRLDSSLDGGGEVTRYYDPMIAKVIAHAPSRETAAHRLASSLASATIDGITTNRELLVRTLRHPEFLGDRGDSQFLERNDPALMGRPLVEGTERAVYASAAALAIQAAHRRTDPHTAGVATGFRNVATAPQSVTFSLGDQQVEVAYRFERGRLVQLAVDAEEMVDPVSYGISTDRVDVAVDGVRRQLDVRVHPDLVSVTGSSGGIVLGRLPRFVEPEDQVEAGSTVATMPGTIVAVSVEVGDAVAAGDVLVVMEAMKMELSVTAGAAGVVTAVPVAEGDSVEAGAALVVVDETG